MKKASTCLAILVLMSAGGLLGQMDSLTFGEDYTLSAEVSEVTTVKVAPNRIDHYLAGLARSWVPAVMIGQEMGLNAGHAIYVSELPNSGDFNVVLVTRFESLAQREKSNDPKVAKALQEKVEAKLSEDDSFRITEGYTQIREIAAVTLMREVTLKE
jgi:hypothetical protein